MHKDKNTKNQADRPGVNPDNLQFGSLFDTLESPLNKAETFVNEVRKSKIEPPENIPEEKRVWTAEDLLNNPEEAQKHLISPIFPQTGLAALVGGSDTGKSMALRQLSIEIVARRPSFIGFVLTPKYFSVLVLTSEDGVTEVSFLLSLQAAGVDPELLKNLVFIFAPENGLEEAEAQLKMKRFDLIICDSWGDISVVDPSDNGNVRKALKGWASLAHRFQCLVIFLHHTGKTTDGKAPSKHNTIGAQSFEAKMRTVIELRRDGQDDNLRHFCIVKANGLPQAFKNESFVLDFDPETFLFSNTGQRRPFDELASPEHGQRPKRKADNKDIGRAVEVLLSDGGSLSRSDFLDKLCDNLDTGKRTIEDRLGEIIRSEKTFANEHGQVCALAKETIGKVLYYRLIPVQPF